MERNEIKVYVVGLSHSGKSTVATVIANALKKNNLNINRVVEFENDLEDIPTKVKSLHDKNTVIEIIEQPATYDVIKWMTKD
jgi:nucleoside-triphosphatase THEP1